MTAVRSEDRNAAARAFLDEAGRWLLDVAFAQVPPPSPPVDDPWRAEWIDAPLPGRTLDDLPALLRSGAAEQVRAAGLDPAALILLKVAQIEHLNLVRSGQWFRGSPSPAWEELFDRLGARARVGLGSLREVRLGRGEARALRIVDARLAGGSDPEWARRPRWIEAFRAWALWFEATGREILGDSLTDGLVTQASTATYAAEDDGEVVQAQPLVREYLGQLLGGEVSVAAVPGVGVLLEWTGTEGTSPPDEVRADGVVLPAHQRVTSADRCWAWTTPPEVSIEARREEGPWETLTANVKS